MKKRHDDLNDLVNILRRALHELEGNQEMLSDQLEGVHYGLVMLGGYSNHSEFNPQQRQHVYNVAAVVRNRFCALAVENVWSAKGQSSFAHWQGGMETFQTALMDMSWPLHKDETHKTRLQSLTKLLDLACESTLHY